MTCPYDFGGAILNKGTLNVSGAEFTSNEAVWGGAIENNGTAVITDSTFRGNTAQAFGGAIDNDGTLTITGSTFSGNTTSSSYGSGGAIYNWGTVSITDSTFSGNTAYEGGAIYTDDTLTITDSTFSGNMATLGGAIYTDDTLTITGSTFSGNTAAKEGGAVYNSGSLEITGSSYTSNSSGSDGGAVYSSKYSDSLEISSSSFTNNSSSSNGGAIATLIDSTITDTSFTGNTASGNGGAVYASANLTIASENSDVTFSSNSASSGGDIYMSVKDSTLALNSSSGTTMTFESGISGNSEGYTVNVNSTDTETGTVVLNSTIENATITTTYGTLHLAQTGALVNSTLTMGSSSTLNTINNYTETFGSELTLASGATVLVDVDLGSGTADNFSNATTLGTVVVSEINSIGSSTTANNVTINLANALGIDSSNLSLASNLTVSNALTPIRYLQGSVDSSGNLSYSPTGSSYNDFNPAIVASPVAAQIGGYLTQLNSYDEAFKSMDMYMLMTKSQRQAMKNANKYAASDSSLVFDKLNTPYEDTSGWVRPYTSFESVGLKNGPKVSNVAYGMYGGVDSEMYDLGNGWDGVLSLYAGYNGSHQAYQGNSIYQNGGTLGLAGMAYKDNFFTGLTVNVGANAGQADTMYGNEDFAMLMTGVASKTGYNYELADGKFIIQPSFLMAYSFVNTFDYTNAAGVRINSDPLHAIQLEPGLKFIGNLQNGWQPYAGVSVIWNIMDKTNFKANDVTLPEMSIKPFVKYGLGVRKTWGQRFVGYLQAFLTNGGRNGIGIQTGFRWTLGKNPANYTNSSGEKKYIKNKA